VCVRERTYPATLVRGARGARRRNRCWPRLHQSSRMNRMRILSAGWNKLQSGLPTKQRLEETTESCREAGDRQDIERGEGEGMTCATPEEPLCSAFIPSAGTTECWARLVSDLYG